MANTTSIVAWVMVLMLSLPVLYFIVDDLVPKKQKVYKSITTDKRHGQGDLLAEKLQPSESSNTSLPTEPPKEIKTEPSPIQQQSKPEKPSHTEDEVEVAPEPQIDVSAESTRKRPLQTLLTQSALKTLKTKFSFTDPQCNKFYSQHNQDWFAILNFLLHTKDGFYVDVGANHFQTISNTWFLDKCMGWRGICVEPNPELAKLLRAHRGCHVFNGCISSKASNLTLMIPLGRVHVAGHIVADGGAMAKRGDVKVASVPCMSLAELLKQQKVAHVNFMSLDVEGHEPNAIASFPTVDGPPIDILTIEISTGSIQRALPQYPLLTRGMVSLVPLVGDAIMVRRGFTPLRSHSKLLFPSNPYFENWWNRLCTSYEKISRAACKLLGMDFIDKPRFPISKDDTKDSSQPSFLQHVNKSDAMCQDMVRSAALSSTFSSELSQDWFILNNFFPDGAVPGFYVEVANGNRWGKGSNTWFMDRCLGWRGICITFNPAEAAEWRKQRTCQVHVGCLSKLCSQLDCHGSTCPTLGCAAGQTDSANCQDIVQILQSAPAIDVLSMSIKHAPFIVAALQWDTLRKSPIILVDGTPKTNYKLMHWPLSLRGYVLAATFAGGDVFIQRIRHLLRRRYIFPSRNSTAIRWLNGALKEYGLESSVVDTLLSAPY